MALNDTTGLHVGPSARLWDIDAARGIAVLAMIFFHVMWDMQFFGLTSINVYSPPWQLFARAIGTTFMFVMGISLTLDAAKFKTNTGQIWKRNLKRGLKVLFAGMLVMIATYLAVGNAFVRFGILHLAGVSIILASPFINRSAGLSLVTGMVLIILGVLVGGLLVPFPWLIPFGIRQAGMEMVDYYPLLPWFGVVLLGIATGAYAYPKKHAQFRLPEWSGTKTVKLLQFAGKNSLMIYLIHQPVLIALIFGATQLKALLV